MGNGDVDPLRAQRVVSPQGILVIYWFLVDLAFVLGSQWVWCSASPGSLWPACSRGNYSTLLDPYRAQRGDLIDSFILRFTAVESPLLTICYACLLKSFKSYCKSLKLLEKMEYRSEPNAQERARNDTWLNRPWQVHLVYFQFRAGVLNTCHTLCTLCTGSNILS